MLCFGRAGFIRLFGQAQQRFSTWFISSAMVSGLSYQYVSLVRSRVMEDMRWGIQSEEMQECMYESRASEGFPSASIDLVRYYENKLRAADRQSSAEVPAKRLGLIERSVLRLVNFEVNFKLRNGLQESYDLLAVE